MRVWLGLNAVLMGSALGTFAGYGVRTWANGTEDGGCAKRSVPFGQRGGRCYVDASSATSYVVAGVVLGIALIGAATWWLLRPSTRS